MEITSDIQRQDIVAALVKSYRENAATIRIESGRQISRQLIIDIIDKLRRLIFPGYFDDKDISAELLECHTAILVGEVAHNLRGQFARALQHKKGGKLYTRETAWDTSAKLVNDFLMKLPRIRALMATDVDAFFEGDPAAHSKDEIISSYPGLFAIMVYRLAHEIYKMDIPLIPRVMSEHAHSVSGIDIHPGATVGDHFFIDHGTGVVIGATAVIGNNVKIYQGVTLGSLSTRGGQALQNKKRHPTIEDGVTLYSGASILGGETVIGNRAVVGGNAFVTASVPADTRVSIKSPELQFKNGRHETVTDLEQGFWDWVI